VRVPWIGTADSFERASNHVLWCEADRVNPKWTGWIRRADAADALADALHKSARYAVNSWLVG